MSAQLRMAWSRGLPEGTQESTPIVYRGVMYVMAPGASIQALDATNGDLVWEYQRDYPSRRCPDRTAARSKSLGIYEDMIYFRRAGRVSAGTRCADWQAALGNQGGRRPDHFRRAAGRRRQGDLEPHLSATRQREFCFIAAHDARDRQRGLEVLCHGRARRAGG